MKEGNKIVLRSVYPKTNIKITTNPVKNPVNKRYEDCVKPVDSRGDLMLTDEERNSKKYFVKETDIIVLYDGIVFDLDNVIDKAKWDAVKHNPLIAKSRNARDAKGDLIIDGSSKRYGRAELYIEVPGEESKRKATKRQKIRDCYSYILDSSQEILIKMCKILGRDMSRAYFSDVQDYLFTTAESNPDLIIDLFTGPDTNLRLLLIDAKMKNVITVRNKIYIYGDDTILGATEDAVILWMKDFNNRKLLDLIKKQVYPEYYSEDENED